MKINTNSLQYAYHDFSISLDMYLKEKGRRILLEMDFSLTKISGKTRGEDEVEK